MRATSIDRFIGTGALKSLLVIASPIASGGLLAVAFPPFDLHTLAWIALAPLGFAACSRCCTPESYLGAYLGGLVFHLLGLDWLRTSYGGVGLSGARALTWLLTSLAGGIFWVVALVIIRRLWLHQRWPMAFALCIGWIVAEFLRRHALALIDATGFPWLLLGQTQSTFAQILQSADIGGIWLVGALVAACNGTLVDLNRTVVDRERWPLLGFVATMCLLCAACCYGLWRSSYASFDTGPSIALMPPGSEPRQIYRPPGFPEGSHALASSTGKVDVDLRVWHEGVLENAIVDRAVSLPAQFLPATSAAAYFPQGDVELERQTVEMLCDHAQSFGCALLVGCQRLELTSDGFRRFNSAAFVDPQHGYLGCYDKVFLVPWAEFNPAPRTPLGRLTPMRGSHYCHGTGPVVFSLATSKRPDTYALGVLICYDVCFPQAMVRRRESQRAPQLPEFYVCPAAEMADATGCLQSHLLALTRFRAVESRRAIVRNVLNGYSGLVDSNGQFTRAGDSLILSKAHTIVDIPIDRRSSFYSQFGDWLPCGMLAVLLALELRSGARGLRWRAARVFNHSC